MSEQEPAWPPSTAELTRLGMVITLTGPAWIAPRAVLAVRLMDSKERLAKSVPPEWPDPVYRLRVSNDEVLIVLGKPAPLWLLNLMEGC